MFVFMGLGSVFAGILSYFPFLTILSHNKNILFIISGMILLISGILQFINYNKSCIIIDKDSCNKNKKISLYTYIISLILFVISSFVVYILPKILY